LNIEEVKEPDIEVVVEDGNLNEQLEISKHNIIERFFHNYWSVWMNKLKFFVLGFTVILIAISIWRVAVIQPDTEAISMLPKDHELTKLKTELYEEFHDSVDTNSINVKMIWGISKLDRSGVGKWDPTDKGSLVYDNNFNLAPVANQQRILDI
jgi:hypothetical protein